MIKKLYSKYRELIRYVIFGVLTTAVSLGVYYLCTQTFLDPAKPAQLQLANILSWIAAVSFAFVTNRRYVFEDRSRNVAGQAAAFFLSRLGTLGMDMGLMFLGCTVLGLDDRLVKLAVQFVVLAANYLLSKLVVFRKGRDENLSRKPGDAGLYLLYTVLFAGLAALVYLPFWRGGKSFVWIDGPADGLYQHFNAFVYLGQYVRKILMVLLHEHRFVLPMWEFSIGMGGDAITTLSFYGMGDPFSLVSVLFQPEKAELGYALMILLKMYCAGLAFSLYARKMGAGRTGTLCGALAYVFSSFLLYAANRHPSFITPVLWLPLILYGVEKLLRKESPAPFVLGVFFAAVSNFYFFYMVAVFTAMYVLLRGFGAAGRKPVPYVLLLLRVAGLALIGIAMAGMIFLPSVMAFLGSSRLASEYVFNKLYTLKQYSTYPGTLISSAAACRWAYIGVSAIGLAGIFLEFIRKRKERWPKVQLLLFYAFMLLPSCGYALNGFGYVTNRWVFAYVLLACFLLARNLEITLTGKQKLALGVCVLAYTALCLALPRSRLENTLVSLAVLWISVIFLAAVCVSPQTARPGPIRTRLWQGGVIALTVLGILVNGYYRISPEKSDYVSQFTDAGAAISMLNGGDGAAILHIQDEDFYRIDTGRRGHINRNYALHQGISSTSVYFSILPKYQSEYLCNMQAYDQMLDMYKGLQSRTLLLPFASAKYYISQENYRTQTPYGYEAIGSFTTERGNPRVLYQTKNVLPLGYTCDSYMSQQAYLDMTTVQRQQAMLQAAVLPDGAVPEGSTLRRCEPVFTDHTVDFTAEKGENAVLEDGRIVVKKNEGWILLSADCPANEELYLQIEGLDYDLIPKENESPEEAQKRKRPSATAISANAEHTTYSSANYYTPENIYAHGRHDFLLNLYTSSKPRGKVRVRFSKAGVYTFDSLKLVSQPLDMLAPSLDALRQDVMTDVKMETNLISGRLSLDREKILCLSIPYSDGWRLTVDGAPAELLRVNDMYMGAILPPGDHELALSYTTPYLKAGLALSLLGAALLALLCLLRKRRRKT